MVLFACSTIWGSLGVEKASNSLRAYCIYRGADPIFSLKDVKPSERGLISQIACFRLEAPQRASYSPPSAVGSSDVFIKVQRTVWYNGVAFSFLHAYPNLLLLKSFFHAFPTGLRAPSTYQRLPSLQSYRDSTLARLHSEKRSPMLFLLTRNRETRQRDTMTRTSSGELFLCWVRVFEGSIVFHVVISWCRTTVVERIDPMEHETQIWWNSILVISYVN